MMPQGWAGSKLMRLSLRVFLDRLRKLGLVSRATWDAAQTAVDKAQLASRGKV
jgi:hypothetical protein